ncbi:MAG TPA: right-handed parallel beta-helix repeat-containing protein [Anaerolineales bacterium]|nr:right-handed parallel beta-helix repeat-containing protein [Anaerolineales bacterium]
MTIQKYARVMTCLVSGGILVMGLFLFLGTTAQTARADPGDMFARPGASGTCAQSSPCSLQAALSTANDGDAIYLAGGTYTSSGGAVMTITHNIDIYGGWNGSATGVPVLNPNLYPSTIDGQGARRGVFVNSGATVTLQGLIITNGWDDYQGAGVYAQDASLTLRQTTVYSNAIDIYDTPDTYAYGSGLMLDGGTLVVEESTFRSNSAWARKSSYGGGIAAMGAVTVTVVDTLFEDNDAWHASGLYFLGEAGGTHWPLTLLNNNFVNNGLANSGTRAYGGYAGAIEVSRADAQIDGNIFKHNNAGNDYGGIAIYSSRLSMDGNWILENQSQRTVGLYLYAVSPFNLTNNVIAQNQTFWARQNAALRIGNSQGWLAHNTLAQNSSVYGMLLEGSTVELANTILVSHTVGISVTAGSTATLEATLWGSGDWANDLDWGGEGVIETTSNLWEEPGFVDPGSRNYHINSASKAIDAGVNADVMVDIDGQARPAGSGYDIGADEFVIQRLFLPLVRK